MRRSATQDAIILKTQDVGEADRFCIVFTRTKGRLALRARGVRKTGSRMGGTLLPYRRVQLDITETDSGFLATGVMDSDPVLSSILDHGAASRMGRGIEVLLMLTEDLEPLPEVFDLTVAYLRACIAGLGHPVLAYELALLARLGLLPATDEDPRFADLSPGARAFVLTAATAKDSTVLASSDFPLEEVERFRDQMFAEQLPRPLKARQL
jgi:DNA repair protein RecO (recombination protein O)